MKLILVLVAALAVGVIASHESYWNDADWKKYVNTNDNVVLPGQPSTPKVTQQAGYITVDPVHGGEYFFWAQNAMKSPDTAPVVLWMTGGTYHIHTHTHTTHRSHSARSCHMHTWGCCIRVYTRTQQQHPQMCGSRECWLDSIFFRFPPPFFFFTLHPPPPPLPLPPTSH